MARILLRSNKDPFEPVSAEEALRTDYFGANTGNLLFSAAAHKILATRATGVFPDRQAPDPDQAARINDEYDAYVLPLANAFRPGFASQLDRFSELIEQLTIPVVIVGVGCQVPTDGGFGALRSIEVAVRRFITAVLERSASIGVRGEYTLAYLQQLGFNDVRVIGCPSMYMNGPTLPDRALPCELPQDARLAVSLTPRVRRMAGILAANAERYRHLTYVMQDHGDLRLLLRSRPLLPAPGGEDLPVYALHPLLVERRALLFLDPWPWMDFLATQDFAFGTRVHGNIAAALAGTPSTVVSHDSRSQELADYLDLPRVDVSELVPGVDAAELYLPAAVERLRRGHPARFDGFVSFLAENGLATSFDEPDVQSDFCTRLRTTDFPGAVMTRSLTSGWRAIARSPRLVRALGEFRARLPR
jgi:hypothetical protein